MASSKKDDSERPQTQVQEEAHEVDSEDEQLALAAAQWASAKNNKDTVDGGDSECKTSTSTSSSGGSTEPASRQQQSLDNDNDTTSPQSQSSQPLSLHVTQLSFQATDYHVRSHFVENGCTVTSVRLVYDHSSGHTKTFRGVAFVDVADNASFQAALQLNRTTLLGRRINVRPTKTKSELASIVQRTRQVIAEKIHSSREEKGSLVGGNSKSDMKRTHREMQHGDGKDAHKKRHKSKHEKQSTTTAKDGSDRKLTKKERNRRAAIIMSKRRGRK